MLADLIDLWAAVAALAGSICLGLRANLLKPEAATWCTASTPVTLSLAVLSATLAGATFSILGAGRATAREAVVYTALAIASAVLLNNLRRQVVAGDDD